jgi:alpha-L-rhamnosidase
MKFSRAKPIWLEGLSETMNITAGVRTVFEAGSGGHRMRIAGASVYRIRLNGEFLGYGPARCGHDYYRVDEWELPVVAGKNLLAVEIAGYNANGFATLDQRIGTRN